MGNKSIYSVGNDAAITGKVQRKTERSHEENQERAYVAASRRADRSIEARVQSARMASEIHKKRTGKGFRISEEIVVKEEMYEEEEEFFPRSHKLLGPHMQTASPELNLRMEAYLTNRMAMSAMVAGNNDSWRQNDIHTRFAQFFPDASRQAQQISQRMSQQMDQSPVSPTFSTHNEQQSQNECKFSGAPSAISAASGSLSPHSNPETPATQASPAFTQPMTADSPMEYGSNESIFTAELPEEAKMLMAGSGMNMDDPFTQTLYGGQDWSNNGPYYNFNELPHGFKGEGADMEMQQPDYYGDGGMTPVKCEHQEINWGTFVNEDWDNNDQK